MNVILDKLETLADAIINIPLNNVAFENIEGLDETAKKFQIGHMEMAILSLVVASDPLWGNIDEAFMVNRLKKFTSGKRSGIQATLSSMNEMGVLTIFPEPEQNIRVSRKYNKMIQTGDWDAIKNLRPVGLIPFLKNFMTVLENTSSTFGRDWHPLDSAHNENLFIHLNQDLTLVKYFHNYLINHEYPEMISYVFFGIIAKKVLNGDSAEIDMFLGKYNKFEVDEFKQKYLINQTWDPIEKGYFEVVGHHYMKDNIELEFTDLGISELVPELEPDKLEALLNATKITVPHKDPSKIDDVKLLFDAPTLKQLKPMMRLMEPAIREKIREQVGGRNKGISMLLYGAPGTGKTEYCLQLAKKFNMPVMQLNVAEIQSKWVGDSEKNAVKAFRQYQKLRKQSKRECILLINECDALLSKRVNVNTSIDEMSNALKNIFLEQLEEFEGIVMATSNLTDNLDSAFERRFLYKVCLAKPAPETAAKIWNLYFQGLPKAEATRLSKDYDFSPGEISNIKRKYDIEKILGSKLSRTALIQSLCKNERIVTQRLQSGKTVGFN